jgi:transposase-like protein
MSRPVRFSEDAVRAAVAESFSYAEVLRRLGIRTAGGNHRTIRKYVDDVWEIPTDHFDPRAGRAAGPSRRATPLAEILVERSTYHRGHLKRRLLAEGIKQPMCEMCGQGEVWRGQRMALILDHVNGVHDDHRLENLRILCPNCNATLDTHCGRHNRRKHADRICPVCATAFRPANGGQQYCSWSCGGRGERSRRVQRAQRRVERPPYEQLLAEIQEVGYLAVGRKYGVTDNAIRKWRRAYEAERRAAGSGPPAAARPSSGPPPLPPAPPDDRARAEPPPATGRPTATAV